MFSFKQFEGLSRLELYSVINRLKREVNCLTKDLIQYEIHLNRFQKLFENFSQTIDFSEELLDLTQEIKILNTMYENQCYIHVNNAKNDLINDICEDIDSTNCEDSTSNKRPKVKSDDINLSEKYQLFRKNMGWLSSNDQNSNESNDKTNVENSDSHKQYVCQREDCGKAFSLRSSYTRHMQVHEQTDQDQVFYCQFEGCGKPYKSDIHLKAHERRHVIKYRCDFEGCTFGSAYKSYLIAHSVTHSKNKRLAKKHSTEMVTPTDQNSNESNDGSIDEESGDYKRFVCRRKGCGRVFANPSSWRKHSKTHNEMDQKNVFHCQHEGCHKSFNSSNSLHSHRRRHNIKYRCDVEGCGYGSCDKSFVRRHLFQVHHKRTDL